MSSSKLSPPTKLYTAVCSECFLLEQHAVNGEDGKLGWREEGGWMRRGENRPVGTHCSS